MVCALHGQMTCHKLYEVAPIRDSHPLIAIIGRDLAVARTTCAFPGDCRSVHPME